MNRSKIEWTNFSWNPIKGLCPVNCKTPDGKEYCYARRMYKRFGWNPELSLEGELFGSCQDAFSPNIRGYELCKRIKPGSKIFICSTMELFHLNIYKEWRDAIFEIIKDHPCHTFQILTKFPQNIDREMPPNVWLGTSVTSVEDDWRIRELYLKQDGFKFISFEPLFEDMSSSEYWLIGDAFNWIIVGRLTQHGHECDPKREWIEYLVNRARQNKQSIFLKDNLKDIWGSDLIQEFPKRI